ncbi:MAG TPA: hydantoinase B/oxoprolinase family protein [Stellaceae bacterium]|nr:hydantoinase B/oxoprolinase family protein [Stellaceae bacterium]
MSIATQISPTRNAPADPVLTEIVRAGVKAVTNEMKTNLTRTAYNTIIYEALDFTVGLFTADGRTVSIGLGLPMFIRGMREVIAAKLAHFGADIHPGDILVTNDAYTTGSHLNHITLTLPIFFKGELVGFSCCMAHWLDIGGTLGGVTTDIYSEGLQIPLLKLQSRGKINQDLVDIIRMNVRFPENAIGDLRAQITAVKTGEKRFLELVGRYGPREVRAAIDHIMDLSEQAARARTLSIPDGTYEAESYMDDDGVDLGKKVPIKVKVIVAGDRMTIDLSGVAPQVRGFYNSGQTTAYACAQVAYKCLTSPTDYPINDGSFRPLEVVAPLGRVVSAVKPAAMRRWMTFPMTIVDTVFRAMAPAIPERVAAGHHADLIIALLVGLSEKTKRVIIAGISQTGGGWGAKLHEDGVSATIAMNDGDTHNSPVELLETKYPFVVERYELVPDSCGAGRNRGGLGCERVVRVTTDLRLTTHIDRSQCAPWGLFGGGDALPNRIAIRRKGQVKDDFGNAKIYTLALAKDDAVILRGGGGGGFGSPLERAPGKVREDVFQGYVSREAARDLYGVVIDPATGEVDEPATEALRARMRAAA